MDLEKVLKPDQEKPIIRRSPVVMLSHDDSEFKLVGECLFQNKRIVDEKSKFTNESTVNIYHDQKNGTFIITHKNNDSQRDVPEGKLQYSFYYRQIPFGHGEDCPVKALSKIIKNSKFSQHGHSIGISSCAVVMDDNKKILITKRKRTLRTFPGAWVVPGGGVELKESIIGTAVRELEEEVGINLQNHPNFMKPFYIWESVYPSDLKYGLPQSQSLVIYFLVKLNEKAENIKLKLQENEVSCALWISADKLCTMWNNTNSKEDKTRYEIVKTLQEYPNYQLGSEFSLEVFRDKYPNKYSEGLGEGSISAIKSLVNRKYFGI